VNGIAVSANLSPADLAMMISDGSHGALLGWDELRGGEFDVFSQHLVTSAGLAVDASWPVNGAPVVTAAGDQFNSPGPWMARDGAGGAIFTYVDPSNGVALDIDAQRILANGTLPEFTLTGHVTASCGSGLNGVAVDAYLVGTGDLVGTGVTNASGVYSIPGLCSGGSYTATVVTPLDYAATAQDLVANSCASTADFGLTCLAATGTPNSMGYWKHQVGVATGGNGHADVDAATLCGYLDLIAVHFNNNLINQVIVYQPPASGLCSAKLQVARNLLNLQGSAAMIARARQMLLSLLMNVASSSISQTQLISADGATVSQAITYSDQQIDSPTGNYEKVKTICDMICNGQQVPAGQIPLTTAQIQYRLSDEGISFKVGRNPGPQGARDFTFMTSALGPVSVKVFDIAGRQVANVYGGTMGAGFHTVRWTGVGPSGQVAARGIYFARLKTPRTTAEIKLTLTR
jgi:hypothetical protein